MTERTFNAADETQVRERKRTAKDAAEFEREELRELLKLPMFRRYVWRLMDRCGLLRSAFSPNGSQQSLLIGRQDVARELWKEIEDADPLAIPKMMTEHYQEQSKG